jgi:cytochrome c biogenesis protein
VQPDAYFDLRLPDRVAIAPSPSLSPEVLTRALRRRRFGVREVVGSDGLRFVYGDRNRWTKLATLISHLGLILFLVAGLVTARLGDEQGLVVAEGDTLTVQPIGTPGLLLVKNFGFEAPGLDTGSPSDFTTDLAVYRDGQLLARKVIRVNDPLGVAGFTFHENGFRPAPILRIADAGGALLWDGPVAMTDSIGGSPYVTMSVPGRDMGLRMLLRRGSDGVSSLFVQPYRAVGTNPDGTVATQDYFPMALAVGDVARSPDAAISVALRGIEGATILIAKQDPGQGFVWAAFASLITGLLITFYFPRRRVWARVSPAGELQLVGRFDRYVDFVGEFGRLLDDLVGRRRAGPVGAAPPNG